MTSAKNSRDQVWDVFSEALMLFDQKNADYGDAWRRNGWRGNLPRLFEKSDRVKSLLWRNDPRVPAVGDETAVQTLVDMMNTLAFCVINLREEVEFGHEVPRSLRIFQDRYQPGETTEYFRENGLEDTRTVSVDRDVLGSVGNGVQTGPDEEPVSSGRGDVKRKTGRPVTDNPQA